MSADKMPEPVSLVARPLLYTESVNGQQVCRDDLWIVTTHLVNRAAALELAAPVQAQGVLTDERAAFEAHILSLNPDIMFVERWPNDGDYKHHATSGWWKGWQARAILAAQAPASDALDADAGGA